MIHRSLLVVFVVLLSAGMASPARAAAPCDNARTFTQQLRCWDYRATEEGPNAVVVTLNGPLDLDAEFAAIQPGELGQIMQRLRKGPLIVLVPAGKATGRGGTVLLLLADKRRVADSSTITGLDADTAGRLTAAGLHRDPASQRLFSLVSPSARQRVTGRDLLGRGAARKYEDYVFTPGQPAAGGGEQAAEQQAGRADEAGDGGLPWLMILAVSAAVLVLVFLFWRVRPELVGIPSRARPDGDRSRDDWREPRPQPVPQPAAGVPQQPHRVFPAPMPRGPRRTATVRTALHPQGYVELDNCLYRAAWTDADVPPPAPGGVVQVARGSDALWLAAPAHR